MIHISSQKSPVAGNACTGCQDILPRSVSDLIRRACPALTAITVFELYAGVSGAERLAQIDDLVSVSVVFSFDAEEALAAAAIYNDLRRKGEIIEEIAIRLRRLRSYTGALGDLVPYLCLKCLVNFTYDQNAAMGGLL